MEKKFEIPFSYYEKNWEETNTWLVANAPDFVIKTIYALSERLTYTAELLTAAKEEVEK